MTIDLGTVLAAIGLTIGAAGIILTIFQHFLAEHRRARITNPPNNSENGGRRLAISGEIPHRKRDRTYWIAIQPADCRESGAWWPQNRELTIESGGTWELTGARLGRDGDAGENDVNKSYTIGLFEVTGPARQQFARLAAIDKELKPTKAAKLHHSIQVRRVRYQRHNDGGLVSA
jgi:hypothetical protein